MSSGMNRFAGIGNLSKEVEFRVTDNGQQVLKLNVACSTSYTNKDKELQETTEFVRATVFGKRAEALAKILQKGDRIYFEGRLATTSYEKDGVKKYSTEVNVNDVILCGSPRAKTDDRRASSPQTSKNPMEDDSDEIHF